MNIFKSKILSSLYNAYVVAELIGDERGAKNLFRLYGIQYQIEIDRFFRNPERVVK